MKRNSSTLPINPEFERHVFNEKATQNLLCCRIPTELEAQADILPIDTTLLEASSLKNQFAGSLSKRAGYDKGDLKQEFLGYRLRFWLTPKNEYDSDAPILEVLDNKTTPARIISSPLRKYFSMSVRCIQE